MKRMIKLATYSLGLFVIVACGSGSGSGNKNAKEEAYTVTGEDGKTYKTYQEACRAQDFEAAHQFLDHYYNKYMERYGKASDYESYGVSEVRSVYQSAANYIFKQEMMYLISDGSEQAADKVLYLLTEIPVEGTPHPEGQYGWNMIREDCEKAKDHTTYCKWVANYNANCNQIIDLAISQNNNYLAKKALMMYKQNIVHEKTKDEYGRMQDYLVKYTWADKEAAIAKCKAAGIDTK